MVPRRVSTIKQSPTTEKDERSNETTTSTSIPKSGVKQGEHVLPYTAVSHTEPKNEHEIKDPDKASKADKLIDINYDDADIDLIERDIRLFDNYNNISSSLQR